MAAIWDGRDERALRSNLALCGVALLVLQVGIKAAGLPVDPLLIGAGLSLCGISGLAGWELRRRKDHE